MLWWWGCPAARSGSGAHPRAHPVWQPQAQGATCRDWCRGSSLPCPSLQPRSRQVQGPGAVTRAAEAVCVHCPTYPPPWAHDSGVFKGLCKRMWRSVGTLRARAPQQPNPPCPLHSLSARTWCVFIPCSKSSLSSPGGRGKGRKLEAPSAPRKGPAVGFSAQAPEPSPQAHPS